jgi:pimeloyl-ACP methyl ester carboxylesterase
MAIPGLEHKRFKSFDGLEIAYQVRGRGPTVVLANGLGGTFEAFRHIYAALGDRYRIICWDYRGLYNSDVPRNRETLSVRHHCDDLEQLLDHEGVDSAVFVGWSMGVQVNFEFWRHRRRRIDGIIAINGTYGRPFNTAMSSRVVRYVVPTMLKAIRSQSDFMGKATRTVVGWQGLIGMMKRFGMVSKTLDVEAFAEVASGFKTLDWDVYGELLERLGEHDARDVLTSVDCPLLIITGDKDVMTPPFTAQKMHRSVAGSRLVVIEGGTHYTPVEYPSIIRDEIRDFLSGMPRYTDNDNERLVPGAAAAGAPRGE